LILQLVLVWPRRSPDVPASFDSVQNALQAKMQAVELAVNKKLDDSASDTKEAITAHINESANVKAAELKAHIDESIEGGFNNLKALLDLIEKKIDALKPANAQPSDSKGSIAD
jgi:hypothetical protein